MTATWPLDDDVLVEGYEETFPELVLRTAMDAPIAKTRRRFTAAAVPIGISLGLSRAEVAVLEAFYLDDLGGGALPFAWRHPRTGAAASLRFTAPPKPMPIDGERWRVALQLEVLP